MVKVNNESFWEALKSLRDSMEPDEQVVFDQGFTITSHGQDEHTMYVIESDAHPNAWTISCDLGTGFWY